MKYYKDSTGKMYGFDDSVKATGDGASGYIMSYKDPITGTMLTVKTPPLYPYTLEAPSAEETLAARKNIIKSKLSAWCQQAITSGFYDGTGVVYPSDLQSQYNIITAASLGGKLWCRGNASGAWGFEDHTVAEAQQVLTHMQGQIQTYQTQYAELLKEVDTAESLTDLEAVKIPVVTPIST